MKISEVTKRNITDELKMNSVVWYGRLSEIDFLNRMVNLKLLPSTDQRFPTMEEDIWQHRINNNDWEYWWIFEDERLNLFGEDKLFLEFISQVIHPLVRSDPLEVNKLLDIFNSHLIIDGIKIVEVDKISGRPIFKAVEVKSEVDFKSDEKISKKFAKEQLKKCEDRISKKDYNGAISASRSFLEGIFEDIYLRIVGEELEKKGDLNDKYKRIKNLLKFSPEQFTDSSLKRITGGFMSIISGVNDISNSMGDRHTPEGEAKEYHALLCLNTAKIICDFLYTRLDDVFESKENIYEGLIAALSEERRSLSKEKLLEDPLIKKLLGGLDTYVRLLLKEKFLKDYKIISFQANDIFFAAMRLFYDDLDKSDLEVLFLKCSHNSQTLPPYGGLMPFLKEIKTDNKINTMSEEILSFLK